LVRLFTPPNRSKPERGTRALPSYATGLNPQQTHINSITLIVITFFSSAINLM